MSDGNLKNSYIYTTDFDSIKPQQSKSFAREISGFTELELSKIFISFSQVPLSNKVKPPQVKGSIRKVDEEPLNLIKKILESELE